MSILPIHAPSMRSKATRLAPASTTAMFIMILISLAFLVAAAMIWRASSNVMPSAFPIRFPSVDQFVPALRCRWQGPRSVSLQFFKYLFAFAWSKKTVRLHTVLACVQIVVTALKSIQAGMRAALQNQSALYYQYLIGSADSRQPVGDHEGS